MVLAWRTGLYLTTSLGGLEYVRFRCQWTSLISRCLDREFNAFAIIGK